MNVFELFAKVSVNKSQAVGDIRSIETAGKQASTNLDAGFQKLGSSVGKWVKRGAVVAGAAIAALGVTSLKNFATMDTKMREVFTLMPGLSEAAKKQMVADVKDISREIGVLPNEVVPALYQAISAGVPSDNVFEFMETAGKAAIAGVTTLEISVDALSSVVNAYGADVITATQASDAMFTAVRLGKTTFGELGKYLFQVTPVAAAVGVSFDQVAAGMAEITAKGVPTRVAATQLRGMLNELSKSGSEAAKVFEELSGKSFPDFMDEGHDLADVLALMQEYADANNLTLMDMFSSIEGGMAALSLGGANLDSFRGKLAELGDKAGSTEGAFEEMSAGIQFQLDKLAAWWQTVQINIGEEMQEGLKGLLSWVEGNQDKIEQGLIKIFSGLISGLQWIADNGTAVKIALLTIAAGLFAIYAIVNPVQAAMGLLLITTGAIAFEVTKLSSKMRTLDSDLESSEKALRDLEKATDDTSTSFAGAAGNAFGLEEAVDEVGASFAGVADDAFKLEGATDSVAGSFATGADAASELDKELERLAAEHKALVVEQEKVAAAAAAIHTAFNNAVSGVEALAGPIATVGEMLETAYDGLTESSEETAEETAQAWSSIASRVATGANAFLDSVSDMVRGNRELKKSHEDTLATIDQTQKDTNASLAEARAANLADLQKSLTAEEISQEEYAAAVAQIQYDYTQAVADAGTARQDAIDDEVEAYEDAKVTIGEILKEMARNLLVAIREELTLQSAKHLIMGAAALLSVATAALAPGHFLAAGVLAAGAAGLAIAGFAKGGIATEATLGMVGEAGVPEGVLPLTMRNLSAIGQAIASASGFSATPLSAVGIPGLAGGSGTDINIGGGTYPEAGGGGFRPPGDPGAGGAVSVSVHFEGDVSIRDDADIDKLVEGIEDSFGRTRRSLGYAGAA